MRCVRRFGGNPYETTSRASAISFEVTKRTLFDRDQLTSVPGTFGDPIRADGDAAGHLQRTPFGLGLLLVARLEPRRHPRHLHRRSRGPQGLFHPSSVSLDLQRRDAEEEPQRSIRAGSRDTTSAATMAASSRSSRAHFPHRRHPRLREGRLPRRRRLHPRADHRTTSSIAARGTPLLHRRLAASLRAPRRQARRAAIRRASLLRLSGRIDWNLRTDGRSPRCVDGHGSSDGLHVLDQGSRLANLDRLPQQPGEVPPRDRQHQRPPPGPVKLTISPAWGHDSVGFTGARPGRRPFSSIGVRQR